VGRKTPRNTQVRHGGRKDRGWRRKGRVRGSPLTRPVTGRCPWDRRRRMNRSGAIDLEISPVVYINPTAENVKSCRTERGMRSAAGRAPVNTRYIRTGCGIPLGCSLTASTAQAGTHRLARPYVSKASCCHVLLKDKRTASGLTDAEHLCPRIPNEKH